MVANRSKKSWRSMAWAVSLLRRRAIRLNQAAGLSQNNCNHRLYSLLRHIGQRLAL